VRHHEIRPPLESRAGVEHLGDAGVVHQSQRLPLRLEPREDLLRVHAGFDDLQRDPAAEGSLLLSEVDDPHAALANLLEDLVRADPLWSAIWRKSRFGLLVLGRGVIVAVRHQETSLKTAGSLPDSRSE